MEIGGHGDRHLNVRERVVAVSRIRRGSATIWTNEGIPGVRVAVKSTFPAIHKIVRKVNLILGSNNARILIRPFLRERDTHGCLIPKPQIHVS